MFTCALTGRLLETSLYTSPGKSSVTSLSKIYEGETLVYINTEIAHLQTKELANLDQYYDEEYQIYDQSDEDDVLYSAEKGVSIFRQQHQLETLIRKIPFSEEISILDYGCAKGTVMKRLKAQFPFLDTYLFDVSQMYTRLWDTFTDAEHYASYQPKTVWKQKFDVITSFFAFEHTPDPLQELVTIKSLLKPDGLIYLLVPNVFDNVGDFIVADHIHHYTESSLRYMMAKAGFETVEVDTQSHFAAFIVIARNTTQVQPFEQSIQQLSVENERLMQIGAYWQQMASKVAHFEMQHNGNEVAIYGAGVYGNFIVTCLQHTERISCFIDQNPLLKDTLILGKPIVKPSDLPPSIRTVYVGLNPKIAKQVIDGLEAWKNSQLNFFYL